MAKPTDVPSWATDADRRLEPTAGEKGTGWNEGNRLPARKLNWLQGLFADWMTWLNGLVQDYWIQFDEESFFTIWISGVEAQPKVGSEWTRTIDVLTSTANDAELYFDLSRDLPRGASITQVWVLVLPGAARGVGDRIAADLYSIDYGPFASPSDSRSVEVSAEDDGTTDLQWISLLPSPDPLPVADDHAWLVLVKAGNTGAASPDKVLAVRVTYQTDRLEMQ